MHSNLMWFWSVSLADQLLGQFFIFLGLAERKLSHLRDQTIYFVHSLEFFVPSFLKNGHSLIFRPDKKNQESGQKEIVLSLGRVNFFLVNQKK